MTAVLAVAANTFREAIRNRVLYILLAFAIVLIAASMVLSSLSYVEQTRILQNLAFGAMRLFGIVIAIAVGINLIHREVDRRTVYTILSKPVSRTAFLIGKYLGLVATIWLLVAIMAVAFALTSWVGDAPLGLGHLAAVALVGLELAVVVGLATLFSAFTTPMLAALFTTGITAAGHLTRDLLALAAASGDPGVEAVTRWLHRVLPDLESFNLTLHAVHHLPITASDVVLPVFYAIAYTSVLLLLASLIFQRRDFR